MIDCIAGCYHYDYSYDNLPEEAHRLATLLHKQHEYDPSSLDMNDPLVADYNGVLAQLAVFKAIESIGVQPEAISPPFDPNISKDRFDYMHRGMKHDVKGTLIGEWQGKRRMWPKSRLLVNPEKKERDMDYYTFAKLDIENCILHIPGIITCQEFWDVSVPDTGENRISECNYVFPYQCIDWEPWMRGVPSSPRKKPYDYKKDGWDKAY